MKKRRIKIELIRNIHEFQLVKQRLEMQNILYEKEITDVTTDMMNNFMNKLKEYTFDMAYRLVYKMFTDRRKKGNPDN